MSVFIDASALVAMATGEDEAEQFGDELGRHDRRIYCAVGTWEATRAVARKRGVGLPEAIAVVDDTLTAFACELVTIGDTEWRIAIEAHARYGKGTGHPAQLNMGDCFAYACAKANDAVLLYKGDDFVHTDLA